MDEVDGMSKGDRGGLPALCRLIPISKVLVHCLVVLKRRLDSYHLYYERSRKQKGRTTDKTLSWCPIQQVRTLTAPEHVNGSRPGPLQVASRVQHVLQQENLKLDTETVNRIVQSAQGWFLGLDRIN